MTNRKELNSEINKVLKKIKDLPQEYNTREPHVRTQLIEPILRCIGWDAQDDPIHVKQEQPTPYGRIDYLLIKDKPVLIVETKSLGTEIGKTKDIAQILNYCTYVKNVRYGLITNGSHWIFCEPEKKTETTKEKILWEMNLETEERKLLFLKFNMLSFSKINKLKEGLESLREEERSQERQKKREQIKSKERHDFLEISWKNLLDDRKGIVENIIPLFNKYLEKIPNNKRYKITEYDKKKFLNDKISGVILTVPIRGTEKMISQRNTNEESYTNKQISAFVFEGERHTVTSWIDFLIQISNIMVNRHRNEISKFFTLKGRNRRYFSINGTPKQDLYAPVAIEGTKMYVEKNLSNNNKVSVARKLIRHFGDNPADLKIEAQ